MEVSPTRMTGRLSVGRAPLLPDAAIGRRPPEVEPEIVEQRLADPNSYRRLISFLSLHFLAFVAHLGAMALFLYTGDIWFFSCLLVPFLFSGAFCAHAAWCCPAPTWGARVMPVREKHFCCALPLLLLLGVGQIVILILALEEYEERQAKEVQVDVARAIRRRPSGTLRRGSSAASSQSTCNKFHCKAVNGLFEGLLSSAVLLYAFWSMAPPKICTRESVGCTIEHFSWEPVLVGTLGVISWMSSGLGLLELDFCTSTAMTRRMRRSPRYEVLHWLFRTTEVASRVSMFVWFMVTTRHTPYQLPWWIIPLGVDFLFTFILVTLFGGVEKVWSVRLLCAIPCTFANVFEFLDSPYKRRAAKRLSIWLTVKNALEQLALPLLVVLMVDDLPTVLTTCWNLHKFMIVGALISLPLYWILFWFVSSKALHKNNMVDIYSACEAGSEVAVRKAMRDLTHSAAVGLNVNNPDIDGNTPLMLAAFNGYPQICRLLLQEGARVDVGVVQDTRSLRRCFSINVRRCWTPLHAAAWRGHTEVVLLLLDAAGFRLSGRPPTPHAQGEVPGGADAGGGGDRSRVMAAAAEAQAAMDALADSFRDQYGETPLHVAAWAGAADIARVMTRAVPRWAEAVNNRNQRPLDLAKDDEVQQAIEEPWAVQDIEDGRSPLLAQAQLQSQLDDEAWPQMHLAISRTSAPEGHLMAPGLCSYIASSCGGALGRIFLIAAADDPLQIPRHMSVLSGISEEPEGEQPGSNQTLRSAQEQVQPSPVVQPGPRMDDLEPADSENNSVGWWINLTHSRGKKLLQIPEEATLGAGAYGTVWRARDKDTGTIYAVKNVRARHQTGPVTVAMRECQVADHIRQIPHPCIVRLFHVQHYQETHLYVLVMEFCPNGDLLTRIQQAREASPPGSYVPPSQAMNWIGQVFLGLETMHLRMNTLLRDLKPENVVLSSNDIAKLTDFGFGRFGVESDGGWSFGIPTGSPGYVAPEVLHKEGYDYRADLYSLGVLVWVMLTGGLVDATQPVPPLGKMRHKRDFAAHYRDCILLAQCLDHPARNGARALPSDAARDFVASSTRREARHRMRHKEIRQHPFIQPLGLPKFQESITAVEVWLEQCSSRILRP